MVKPNANFQPLYTAGSRRSDWDLLPEHMHDGMQLYVERGIEPGGFMMAVLCNDLRGACERADAINRHKIFNIVAFLYNCVPAGCWGSPEKVQVWIDKGGLQLDE